jgi:hypothetical protein
MQLSDKTTVNGHVVALLFCQVVSLQVLVDKRGLESPLPVDDDSVEELALHC